MLKVSTGGFDPERMVGVYELLAYSIDFEGSITLARGVSKSKTLKFEPRIKINNTSRLLLEKFRDRVGLGRVPRGSTKPRKPGHKELHRWEMTAAEIRDHLPGLIPHLILKKRQAELLLEATRYIQTRDERNVTLGRRRTRESTVALCDIYDQIRALNARKCGISPGRATLLAEARARGVK